MQGLFILLSPFHVPSSVDVCMYFMRACMYVCMHAWVHGCTDAWMHGCMDAWKHGWMDGWMLSDVRTYIFDKYINKYK